MGPGYQANLSQYRQAAIQDQIAARTGGTPMALKAYRQAAYREIAQRWLAELEARRPNIELARGGTEIKVTPGAGSRVRFFLPFNLRKVAGSVQVDRRLL